MDNAIAEAKARGDKFNLLQFNASRNKPQQADKDSAEFAGEMLFRLIDAAYSFDHQLIVTTNTTAEKLSAHWSENGDTYGASIVRRILEMEDGYEVSMF